MSGSRKNMAGRPLLDFVYSIPACIDICAKEHTAEDSGRIAHLAGLSPYRSLCTSMRQVRQLFGRVESIVLSNQHGG